MTQDDPLQNVKLFGLEPKNSDIEFQSGSKTTLNTIKSIYVPQKVKQPIEINSTFNNRTSPIFQLTADEKKESFICNNISPNVWKYVIIVIVIILLCGFIFFFIYQATKDIKIHITESE